MEFTKGKKKSFLSDEYVPVDTPPWEELPKPEIALDKCNFPNCNCEPEVCENMPYVEKKDV